MAIHACRAARAAASATTFALHRPTNRPRRTLPDPTVRMAVRSGAAAPLRYEGGSCGRLVGYSWAEMPAPKRSERPSRIRIAKPAPVLDNGRYAVKRTVGDTVAVSADIFRDGHEKLKAVVRYKAPGGRRWLESELHAVDAHLSGVRWAGEFTVETPGVWQFNFEAWTDRWATWHDELRRKVDADLDEDLSSELSEGVIFLQRALEKVKDPDNQSSIEYALGVLQSSDAPMQEKFDVALGPELFHAMEASQEREGAASLDKPIPIEVDRVKARFSAWYELFPRSFGDFKAVEAL